MPLDETIDSGQAGHIADHEAIHDLINDIPGGYARLPAAITGTWVSLGVSVSTFAFTVAEARIFSLDLAACTIDRLGFEQTTAGGAGATTRVLAWADNAGVPGTLLADSGAIATDGANGVKNATVSFSHAGGRLHLCAVNQAGSPAATLRYNTIASVQTMGASQPTTQTGGRIFVATIAGAGASNPTGAWDANGSPPRVSVRIG